MNILCYYSFSSKYISIKTVVMFDLSKIIINYIYSIVLYDQSRINGDKLTIQN